MDVDEGLKLEQVDDGPSEELGDANENATNSPNDEPSLRSPDDDGESPLEIGDVGIMPSPGGIHDPESNATDKANVDRPSENKTQTVDNVGSEDHVEAATPSPSTKPLCRTANDASGGGASNGVKKLKMTEDEEVETQEEQAEFMRELESFYKERSMEFKPPKFYGEPLNCLKLWKSVVQLGGYDWVTANKLWRQVGESFHPPKTCTTVSWTFRIFYEKALLEYEKHKRQIGELEFPGAPVVEPSSVETEASRHQNTGSGRARRDSAARAMQGWHDQGLIGEPIIKDKNLSSSTKREKHLKNLGVTKQRKPSNVDSTDNDMHVDTNKQLAATVVDIGPPADWVKINVRECKDCFEVYALVPGLLREEVRVQSDPAGRLVITGQPEQLDNPWGITPFKKVVNLPARINPLQTSAIVSLHGRLFVRVPFDRS